MFHIIIKNIIFNFSCIKDEFIFDEPYIKIRLNDYFIN